MNIWRAKYYQFQFSHSRKVVITVRRFKTAKSNRSKKFKQLVIPFEIGRVKEFSFRLQKFRTKRQNKHTFDESKLKKLVPTTATILIFAGILGTVLFGIQITSSHALEPTKTYSTSISSVKQSKSAVKVKSLPASVPVNISIPSVNIDYPIIPVGLDSSGSIAMPPVLAWETGWYQNSPTPGQIGPSIIVGHVDSYKTISVFWRLRYVMPGALIYISRADGRTVVFKVSELKQFNQSSFPTNQVYGNISYPGLRLITCGGTFDTQTESYSQNTVVYASMVN